MAIYVSRGLHGRLVEELGAEIGSGRIAPGERLDVEELERRHGVSRTVVREAIRVLATKGLVDARPKRGTFVLDREHWNMLDPEVIAWRYSSRPDAQFLQSLDEVRRIVEPAGARLAATRHTEEDLELLRAALEAMTSAAADDIEAAVDADLHFHRTLIAATHNEILRHLEIIVVAALRARDMLAMGALPDSDLPGHAAVVEAVADRNPDDAEAAMHQLLDRAATHAGAAVGKA
jgi:GntR family galactonate operon transcriptional repressor